MIGPALTSHEWAELRFEPLSNDEIAIRDDGDGLEIVVYGGPADRTERTNLLAKYKLDDSVPIDRHALAALTLYGQPFGFSREDVAAIRANCEGFRWVAQRTGVMGAMEIEISKLLNIADRIESLLPPDASKRRGE